MMDDFQFPLLPRNEIHAVSLSRYSWDAKADEDLLKQTRTGNPRFFIHKIVEGLAEQISGRLVSPIIEGGYQIRKPRVKEYEPQGAQMAMLFASEMHASQCKRYLKQHTRNTLRAITYTVSLASSTVGALEQHRIQWEHAELHAILYPPDLDPLAKGFWQHTGYGISSRYAKFCMEKVDDLRLQSPSRPKDPVNFDVVEGSSSQQAEDEKSKTVLRRRIAELASNSDIALKEKDVHIFSCGMSAISTVAQALQAIGGSETSPNVVVAYGLLYPDTIQTLEKISGFYICRCVNASSAELDQVESQLNKGWRITALFCEFPDNTLLVTPDLRRLRGLADKYKFMIVCDDTVGTFVNFDILSSVDIVCTSLTKLFSGGCNVMGGSVILNPQGRRYNELQSALSTAFVDTYYPADAILMEANSQDFSARVKQASADAEKICALLKQHDSVTNVH